eukprot:Phypoly_transcript_00841.p1 GENE.Phypoly_transcript_00841~~Phypoly_transcript_00841.p1  ORF type:complete len:1276 (+),score=329.63 Phypoly_transcript_00841:96-3923(+)
MDTKRPKVYAELINTERQYVQDMKMTQEVFLDPVRENGLLNKDEVASLFSNLSALIPLNEDLLKKLEDNAEVGAAFMEMIRHMKVYSIYCSSINNIKERIDGLSASRPKFKHFLETCARNPLCREMLLPDFLIMPLQRICKYPLLLKSLLECTPPEHPDHEALTTALSEMRQLIDMINNRTGIVENIRKLKKLEVLIDNAKQLNLIKSNRVILRTGIGYITKKGKHKMEVCIHLLSDLVLISRMKDNKRELKDIIASQEASPSASKLALNKDKRSSRRLVLEDPKEVLVVLYKIELFTPPPSIDGSDFSGNLLELVDVEDVVDTMACFVKMDKVVERVEFTSVEEKKSWINDVTKATKNSFEVWKKEYFKTILDARMSQRSVSSPATPPTAISHLGLATSSAHSRSSSLGDIRISAVAAAIEGKQNVGISDMKVRKSPRGNGHSPVPPSWISARIHARSSDSAVTPPSSGSAIFIPDTPPPPSPTPPSPTSKISQPSPTSPPTSPTSSHPNFAPPTFAPSTSTPRPPASATPASPTSKISPPSTPILKHPNVIHQKLPSYVSCPDLFSPPHYTPRGASEQNWEVECDDSGPSEMSKSSGIESGKSSAGLPRGDSWRDSQKGSPSAGRRLTIGATSDVAFWEDVRRQNEQVIESEVVPVLQSPRGGSLVRSERRNFAMAVLAEQAISRMGDVSILNGNNKGLSQSQTMTQVIELHKHEAEKKDVELAKKSEEVSKKAEELERKVEELKKKNEDLAKKDDEIEDLKKKLAEETTRARIFRERFQDMQRLYHEAESREKEKPQEDPNALLTAEITDLKKKFADERERRRFYRDRFQETQKLYQESLDSVVEFQEKIRNISLTAKNGLTASGGLEPKKLETQLAEEKLRTKFFKEKFQEMNRLYQESLESVTTFVERSRTAEKMYRTTLEDAQESKRRTQELEGLYSEAQESVAFFKEKTKSVEEACRDSMREGEYFKLKSEKMEKLLADAQKSVALYEGNLNAMSSMLREAQDEALYYKQKAREANSLISEASEKTSPSAKSGEVQELERLLKEERENAEKYKESAEARVQKLEAAVEKYKKLIPASISPAASPRATLAHRRPSKSIHSPSKIGGRTTSTSGIRRRSLSRPVDPLNLEEIVELEDLPDTAEAQEGVDFPWLEFVRANYHRLPQPDKNRISQRAAKSNSDAKSPDKSRLPEPDEKSANSNSNSNSPPSLEYDDDEIEEFEKSETPEPGAQPSSRNRKSRQRANKLQQQIQQKLQQKARIEKLYQKGDVG